MEIISDWLEIISDWDDNDIEQAIIYLFFIVAGLLGAVLALASLGYRIYAFFFPEKDYTSPWKIRREIHEWGKLSTDARKTIT